MKSLMFLLIGLCFLPWKAESKEDIYFKAAAQSGDGVYSLLRRFELDHYSCNFDEFYRLNKLSKNKHLLAGKEYQLPIKILTYNGKSIRSTLGTDNWDQAIRIQEYNNNMYKKGLRADVFTNSNILWVPFHELNCPESLIKTVPPPAESKAVLETKNPDKPRNYSIFGSKYAYTALKSSILQGNVFYVVSGHGGPDPGAMSTRQGKKLCEDEYAYDVALRFCRLLIQHGAIAYMVTRDENDGIRDHTYLGCDTDETVWKNQPIPEVQKERLTQRSEVINQLSAGYEISGNNNQVAVIIHVDSRTRSQKTDVFFYHHPDSEESKVLATKILHTIRQKYRKYQPGRDYGGTVKSRDLHMLREVRIPAVYVELANIRNPTDQIRIVENRNRQLLAEWMLEAFLED